MCSDREVFIPVGEEVRIPVSSIWPLSYGEKPVLSKAHLNGINGYSRSIAMTLLLDVLCVLVAENGRW